MAADLSALLSSINWPYYTQSSYPLLVRGGRLEIESEKSDLPSSHHKYAKTENEVFHTKLALFQTNLAALFHTNLALFHTNLAALFHTNLTLFHTNLALFHTIWALFHTNLALFNTDLALLFQIVISSYELVTFHTNNLQVFSYYKLNSSY